MEINTVNPRNSLKKLLFLNIIAIFFVNVIASLLYWYYSIWWFDMPMHFWGGVFIVFGVVYFFYITSKSTESSVLIVSTKRLLQIFAYALTIFILWEVFEYIVNEKTRALIISPIDSTSDIFFDLAGGAFSVIYLIKKKILVLVSKDESDILNNNG